MNPAIAKGFVANVWRITAGWGNSRPVISRMRLSARMTGVSNDSGGYRRIEERESKRLKIVNGHNELFGNRRDLGLLVEWGLMQKTIKVIVHLKRQ